MRSALLLDRRALVASLSAVLVASGAAAQTAPPPNKPRSLMIAGPAGGRLDHWGSLLAGPLGRSLPGRTPLLRENVGGLDGVTGANRFEVSGEPDGRTALLVPGSAALSWLVGETRAKFDPAHWVPLWAGATSTILVSRLALVPRQRIRVAADGPTGSELPALLALDLMGIVAEPSSLASADARLLQNPGLHAGLEGAAAVGMQPVLALGGMGADVEAARDPMLPNVPTALELLDGRAPAHIVAALRAATVAVQLEVGLVLPQLTPAAAVAQWRTACEVVRQDGEVLAEADRLGIRLVSATTAAACTSGIAGDPAPLLALRHWLLTRYNWRPA